MRESRQTGSESHLRESEAAAWEPTGIASLETALAPDPATLDEEAIDNLGARVQSGVAWKAISQVLLQVSRIIVALVVAHLLSPHEWGVAAMVMVVVGFMVAITDNALGPALVQKPDLTEEDKSTVLWLNVALGIFLAVAGTALAGPLANFYHEPAVRPLFIAASLGFLVSCLGSTHSALLMRAMDFRQLELRQIIATVIGGAAGVSIALMHFGAWAIVGQQLAAAGASTALLWVFLRWRPRAAFSLESLRRLGGFAGVLFGENVLFQGASSLGPVVIGRFLGAAALGTFGIAMNVVLVPTTRVAAPVAQVFFPAFARMSDDRPRLADAWLRSTRLVAAVTCPALVGLAILSSDFVPVILGPQWNSAVVVIQLGALAALAAAFDALMGEVLLALNKPGALFRVTVFSSITTIGALVVGLHWGIIGVMAGYMLMSWFNEAIRLRVVMRSLGVPIRRFVSALSGVAKAVALMAAVLIFGRQALMAAGVSAALTLVTLTIVGGAIYLSICLRFDAEIRVELRRILERWPAAAMCRNVFAAKAQP
jgi:O-antigen/teichoic acid export membrane protein